MHKFGKLDIFMARLLSPLHRFSHRIGIKNSLNSLLILFVLLALVNPFSLASASPVAQELSANEKAQALLASLTPEERVGQLFLMSYQGMDTSEGTPIYDLIVNYHAGGVALLADNDNFTAGDEALTQLLTMNRQLQLIRWAYAQQEQVNPKTGETFQPGFIPPFIAVSQDGDGAPTDQIISGLTPLPNAMSIGATWNTDLARQIGNVLGGELSALGFNLLMGPSEDVLESPLQEGSQALGSRTFGGDPFWVGQMGRAYIEGVHEGSDNRMAVAAKHFPGIGSADRLPEEEIATVRKSLEQLQSFDLPPFFDVTGNAAAPEAKADALLVSHIRYQGFQGNIRTTTRPVSFDQQAFNLLMGLPALASWRDQGGIVISDDLGSRSVRRFYELTNPNQPFDARRVALNAFLAGNDLLYLGNITSSDDPDAYTTSVKILDSFAQKYREDPAFAQRVDQSVLRILALKFKLYGSFVLNLTIAPIEGIQGLGNGEQVAFEVARSAATLISPSIAEMDDAIPDPPNRNDRIVFISDVRMDRQCSQCPSQTGLSVDALQQAVTRLYGPQASGQITPAYLLSYSYADLERMLNGDEAALQLESDLRRAHWIVFSMLNVDKSIPSSQALDRFLAERPELFQQKRLIVFAFNAPYYLDATNISKLTAYFGLYSKGPSFVDVAARLLFRELRPAGSLPVSVPGVGYDLISATMPDPEQVIPLLLDQPEQEEQLEDATLTPAPPLEFRIGNLISLRTGIIYDHNGNPVPDGTPVQFITTLNGEVSVLPQTANTIEGIARLTIQVTRSGALEIKVETEPAKNSEILRFEIPPENEIILTATPTLEPTNTPTPTPSPTIPPPVVVQQPPAPVARPNLADWLVAMLLTSVVGLSVYRISAVVGQVRWGIRSSFLAFIGGLLAYSYLALKLPGSVDLLDSAGGLGVVLVTLSGTAVGLLVTWSWRTFISRARMEG